MKTVVIGSGLAAVGAIRALHKRGVRPIVLDIGRTLPDHESNLKSRLAKRSPSEWTEFERQSAGGTSQGYGRVVPRKLVLGSDYFYSDDVPTFSADGEFEEGPPPWSPALGGFSVGWGGAVLPPSPQDLSNWPITHSEILSNISQVLEGIQLSEPEDSISSVFGRMGGEATHVLKLSSGQQQLLKRLQPSTAQRLSTTVLVGQSRLLTRAQPPSRYSCQKCGECSSGCVYSAIYTAEQDFLKWIKEGAIDYRPELTVFRVSERQNAVSVEFLSNDIPYSIEADCAFVATGATNTTRLLLNSSPNGLRTARIKRTGGVLQLFAATKSLDVDWPNQNTQTSHFIEIFSQEISSTWAHVQVGQPNELLLRRLGVTISQSQTARSLLARNIAKHIVSTMLNVNSAFGPHFDIQIEPNRFGLPKTMSRKGWSSHGRKIVRSYEHELVNFMRSRGFFRIPFARQDSSSSHGYHFGSSFPMSRKPSSDFETDPLGRPFGWKHVHVVDTTTLPEIPGSTVGLLTMANSFRIASQS